MPPILRRQDMRPGTGHSVEARGGCQIYNDSGCARTGQSRSTRPSRWSGLDPGGRLTAVRALARGAPVTARRHGPRINGGSQPLSARATASGLRSATYDRPGDFDREWLRETLRCMSACCDSYDHVSFVPLSSSVGTVMTATSAGGSDAAEGHLSGPQKTRPSTLHQSLLSAGHDLRNPVRCAHHGRQPSSASAAIPCLRARRTRRPRLSNRNRRGGCTPVFSRARAVTRSGACRTLPAPPDRPWNDLPLRTARCPANHLAGHARIEVNHREGMTTGVGDRGQRLGMSAQMVSVAQEAAHRKTGCIPYYIAAAMPQRRERFGKRYSHGRWRMCAFWLPENAEDSYPMAPPNFRVRGKTLSPPTC